MLAAGPLPHRFEGRIRAVHFHLVNDAEKFAEPTLRKASLLCEPAKIFDWQVIDRQASWREMLRAEFTKRDMRPFDVRKIRRDPVPEIRLVHRTRYLSAISRTLMSRKLIESP